MSKISIVGWYDEGNTGDEAFREVFTEAWGKSHELVFSQRPDLSADHIVFGGGGVVCGSYLGALPRDREAYAVGVDIPVNGPGWDAILNHNFKKIYVRSREYAAIAQEQGAAHVAYCPDLAFALASKAIRKAIKKKLGFIVSSDLVKDHSRQCIADVADRLGTMYDIHFMSLYNGKQNSDREIAEDVARRMKTRSTISVLATPQDALEKIGTLSILVTMRFHGAIFATCTGTPFISVATPGKHSLFLEQECMRDAFLDLRDLTKYKLIAAVTDIGFNDDTRHVAKENGDIVKSVLAHLLPSKI